MNVSHSSSRSIYYYYYISRALARSLRWGRQACTTSSSRGRNQRCRIARARWGVCGGRADGRSRCRCARKPETLNLSKSDFFAVIRVRVRSRFDVCACVLGRTIAGFAVLAKLLCIWMRWMQIYIRLHICICICFLVMWILGTRERMVLSMRQQLETRVL